MKQKSGVDIDLGNRASSVAYGYAKKTFRNRAGKKGQVSIKTDGSFSNLILFGKERIGIGSDGIGTKAEIAERTRIYDTLGFDLVAMVADDLAVMGFEPTNLSNVLDVDFIDVDTVNSLMKGLQKACDFAGITVTGGEIAELGNRVGGYGEGMHFNWSATALGTLPGNLTEPIDGSQIKQGDIIISLRSRGFRSNGFSALRHILSEQFGDAWHREKYDENQTWGEIALIPSLIYAPLITRAVSREIIPVGMAHITGGGIPDNLKRTLKVSGTGAVLDRLFPPHESMKKMMKMGNVPPEKAYRWWNMGNGMLVILRPDKADVFLDLASQMAYDARIAGEIVSRKEIKLIFKEYTIKESVT